VSVSERPREAGAPAASDRVAARSPEDYGSTPQVGEEIHIPGPSLIPFITAIGITLIVIGTTIDWIWSAVGGVLFIVTVFIWIRDTRRDVSELPEEHGH
jgi:hypothetical protein